MRRIQLRSSGLHHEPRSPAPAGCPASMTACVVGSSPLTPLLGDSVLRRVPSQVHHLRRLEFRAARRRLPFRSWSADQPSDQWRSTHRVRDRRERCDSTDLHLQCALRRVSRARSASSRTQGLRLLTRSPGQPRQRRECAGACGPEGVCTPLLGLSRFQTAGRERRRRVGKNVARHVVAHGRLTASRVAKVDDHRLRMLNQPLRSSMQP